MELIDKVKLLLGVADKDALIEMLVEDAKTEVLEHCNIIEYNIKFDGTVVKMVIQNYNKARTQGISSEAFSGVTEAYVNGYTADILAFLNKNKRIRFL